jgi:hypothetical protein
VDCQKLAFYQYLDMQGYGLPADSKAIGYGIDVQRLVCHHINNPASGGIGNRLEYVSSDYHYTSICLRKYMGKYLLAQIFFGKIFARGTDRVRGGTRERQIRGRPADWLSRALMDITD